jgi:glucokinase
MTGGGNEEPRVSEDPRIVSIGIDVGGTKIAAGLVEFPSGRPLVRRLIATESARGGEAVLGETLVLARELLREAARGKLKLLGIGLGVAELVDPEGNVTSSQTISWRGLPVRERLSELAPAVVESDVRAAAMAEAKFGAGRPFRVFASVVVGTGISYSLVLDGQPYAGARGNALILSSGTQNFPCPNCGQAFDFVPEEFASGPALVRRYNDWSTAKASSAPEVLAAAEAGTAEAVEVVESAGRAVGNSLGHLVNMLDPEALVIGGGLGLAGGLYWESMVASARRHIWSETNRGLPILPAALGTDAGFIGAAAYAWLRFGGQMSATANRREKEARGRSPQHPIRR